MIEREVNHPKRSAGLGALREGINHREVHQSPPNQKGTILSYLPEVNLEIDLLRVIKAEETAIRNEVVNDLVPVQV